MEAFGTTVMAGLFDTFVITLQVSNSCDGRFIMYLLSPRATSLTPELSLSSVPVVANQ